MATGRLYRIDHSSVAYTRASREGARILGVGAAGVDRVTSLSNVCFGSLADIATELSNVRSTLESGRRVVASARQLSAIRRHMQCGRAAQAHSPF
jgi:hypothetical protein